MGEQKKKRFHMPHAYTLIFLLIVLVAVLTWIIPSGEFQRTMVETSTGEREVVVAGTYHGVSKIAEDGTNLRQGIQAVLTAPALGIQNAIEVLAFVFIIGGVFQIMAKTNALNMGIRSIIDKLGDKEFLMIPILMILFGLGGTTYGMSDELVPFYLLVMPVVFAMGYDSMTTFMISYCWICCFNDQSILRTCCTGNCRNSRKSAACISYDSVGDHDGDYHCFYYNSCNESKEESTEFYHI